MKKSTIFKTIAISAVLIPTAISVPLLINNNIVYNNTNKNITTKASTPTEWNAQKTVNEPSLSNTVADANSFNTNQIREFVFWHKQLFFAYEPADLTPEQIIITNPIYDTPNGSVQFDICLTNYIGQDGNPHNDPNDTSFSAQFTLTGFSTGSASQPQQEKDIHRAIQDLAGVNFSILSSGVFYSDKAKLTELINAIKNQPDFAFPQIAGQVEIVDISIDKSNDSRIISYGDATVTRKEEKEINGELNLYINYKIDGNPGHKILILHGFLRNHPMLFIDSVNKNKGYLINESTKPNSNVKLTVVGGKNAPLTMIGSNVFCYKNYSDPINSKFVSIGKAGVVAEQVDKLDKDGNPILDNNNNPIKETRYFVNFNDVLNNIQDAKIFDLNKSSVTTGQFGPINVVIKDFNWLLILGLVLLCLIVIFIIAYAFAKNRTRWLNSVDEKNKVI